MRTQLELTQAAALLGCSVRTLERAIARGEYAVTHDPRGRRLVDMTALVQQRSAEAAALVDASEHARGQAAALATALQSMAATHQQQVAVLTQHLDSERELAAAARTDAAQARQEVTVLHQRLQRRGGWALGATAAGGLLLASVGALGAWQWQRAEAAAGEVRQVRDTLTHLAAQVELEQAAAAAAARTAEQERQLRVAAEAALGASQAASVTPPPRGGDAGASDTGGTPVALQQGGGA
jgi:hypothetical protein